MPRHRLEDQEFRLWIQTNVPDWERVWDRPNPRYRDGPRDCWFVDRAKLAAKHMPKGPQGQKRPADAVGLAVHIMKIATGEIEETLMDDGKNKAAVELGRKGGLARAKSISVKRRKEIARTGAAARWKR